MHRVLDVVNGIGDVVAPIHHLLLQAGASLRCTAAHPRVDICIVGVVAELSFQTGAPVTAWPRVLARGIQTGAGQVQADASVTIVIVDFRFEAGQNPKGLRISFEPADGIGESIEFFLPVVTEGWVAEIVSQAGDFDNVGITTEGFSEFARDLRDLEGVGQSGSREVILAGDHHLGLRRESPKPG